MHPKVTTRLRHYMSVKNMYIIYSCGRLKHSKTCNHSLDLVTKKKKKIKKKPERKNTKQIVSDFKSNLASENTCKIIIFNCLIDLNYVSS